MPPLKWTSAAGETIEDETIKYENREERLRKYAYAGLVAASAIVLSRVALKFLHVQ